MEKNLQQISDLVEKNGICVPEDHVDEEGLLVCGQCGERKEVRQFLFGKEKIYRCMCKCEREAFDQKQEEMKQKEFAIQTNRLKSVGLTESRFKEWTFANDKGYSKSMNQIREYVDNWKEMSKKNIGLLLFGPVGSGKSFAAGCVANALMEQGVPVIMTNFSRVLNELTKYGIDKNAFIDGLVSYPLLIIDDLGIERKSEFAMEQIYNIIDRRYCTKKPIIVTTNLTYQEMLEAGLEYERLYSRLFEMCLLIKWDGDDLRRIEHEEKKNYMESRGDSNDCRIDQ